jgi:hypothetical protein
MYTRGALQALAGKKKRARTTADTVKKAPAYQLTTITKEYAQQLTV